MKPPEVAFFGGGEFHFNILKCASIRNKTKRKAVGWPTLYSASHSLQLARGGSQRPGHTKIRPTWVALQLPNPWEERCLKWIYDRQQLWLLTEARTPASTFRAWTFWCSTLRFSYVKPLCSQGIPPRLHCDSSHLSSRCHFSDLVRNSPSSFAGAPSIACSTSQLTSWRIASNGPLKIHV